MELWQAPIWSNAYRHGDTDDQIRHALRHIVAFADDPDPDVTLFLGAADDTGTLLEVGVLDTDNGPVVIHAMKPSPDRIARRFGPREEENHRTDNDRETEGGGRDCRAAGRP